MHVNMNDNVSHTEYKDDCTNSSGPNCSTVLDYTWQEEEFGGFPMIYPITTYHLYHIIFFGRVCNVIWFVIGVVGNFISLRIWTLTRMKRLNSSALYLAGITVCDILYQITHVFFYLKYFWGKDYLGVIGVCQTWNVLYIVPQYGSQLLVLGFTMERFISIFRPFRGERFSKTQRSPKAVASILGFAVVIASPQAYFWEPDSRGFCELGSGEELLEIYTIWSFVSEGIIFFLIPFLTLLLNVFVLHETHKVVNRHRHSDVGLNGTSRVLNKKASHYQPATKTLLCISFFRILTQLPVSVTYTIQNLKTFNFGQLMPLAEMSRDQQWQRFIPYWGTRIFIETIGASHHALTVFIFYLSTKQFRNELRKLFTTKKPRVIKYSRRQRTIPEKALSSEFMFLSSFYKTTETCMAANNDSQ